MAGRRTLMERLRFRSLAEAAADLNLTQRQLKRRLDQGILQAPSRTESGRYLWTKQEVARARKVLDAHPELMN